MKRFDIPAPTQGPVSRPSLSPSSSRLGPLTSSFESLTIRTVRGSHT